METKIRNRIWLVIIPSILFWVGLGILVVSPWSLGAGLGLVIGAFIANKVMEVYR